VVDTTFFCFLVDAEHNSKGNMLASPGDQFLSFYCLQHQLHLNLFFSSQGLQKLVGKYESHSKRAGRIKQLSHGQSMLELDVQHLEHAEERATRRTKHKHHKHRHEEIEMQEKTHKMKKHSKKHKKSRH
jgi:hypothetical protein